MTTWVRSWDDSFQPVPISRLHEMYAAGYRVWCRYVGPGSTGKHWTKAQIEAWFACGPDTGVGMLAEGVGDEPLYNPLQGSVQGKAARASMLALGLNPDVTLCSPAVDRNVSKSQTLGAVADYMRGWITGYGAEPVPYIEVENGGRLVDAHLSAGTFVPAAYSWNESGKLVTPANAPAHVVQTQERNGVKLAGGALDIGHIRTDAPHVFWNPAGQHGSAQTTGDDEVTPEDIDAVATATVKKLLATGLGSSGVPTVGVALQSGYNDGVETLGLVKALPTTAAPAAPLTDADKDDIAKRVADLLAGRLES